MSYIGYTAIKYRIDLAEMKLTAFYSQATM